MPIHDWTRVSAGLFHPFHQRWVSAISDALNGGLLPPDYFALAEQVVGGPIPDVLALQVIPATAPASNGACGVAVATAPPQTRFVCRLESEQYARRADQVAVRHHSGRVVAVIEIVSPGNKGSRRALRDFVAKAWAFLDARVNLLIVDLFPPTPRDPRGLHAALWAEADEAPFEPPPDKPLTCAVYAAEPVPTAYVEPVAIGDALPELPLFLDESTYIPLALEPTYQATWAVFPAALKPALQERPA